jgi:hypothetical protein
MSKKKRLTRAEQDKALETIPPDTPLPKFRNRCTRRRPKYGDLKTIETLTAIGLNMGIVAADCGVSRDTLERWAREYSDVATALSRGRMRRRKRAYNCFFQQAFPIDSQGRPTLKGNPQLMIFWMRTRERWVEAEPLEKPAQGKSGGVATPTIIYSLKAPVMAADEVEGG